MDSYIKLSIRKMKAIIQAEEWDDGERSECGMLSYYKDPFLSFHAVCGMKSDGMAWGVVSFHDESKSEKPSLIAGERDILRESIEMQDMEECRVAARQWLLDNVEKAYELLLNDK